MQFLQPIWLAAMSGVIIPVIIHLWNNRRGNVQRVGSIAMLDRTSMKKARSIRVTEWVLLVLRCLLIVLLAVLLAGPTWRRVLSGAAGWVLAAYDGDHRGDARVDSLVAAGWERHTVEGKPVWAGVAALDRRAPAGVPFFVVADGRMRSYTGTRPITSRPVHWEVLPVRDSVASRVYCIWRSDSVRIIEGVGSATGVEYRHRASATGEGDTQVVKVIVEGRDKRYVTAAIHALAKYTHVPMEIVSRDADVRVSVDSLARETGYDEQAWNGELPMTLQELLLTRHEDSLGGLRQIDAGQVGTVQGEVGLHGDAGRGEEPGRDGKTLVPVDMGGVIWVLLVVLLVAERWLAFKRRRDDA